MFEKFWLLLLTLVAAFKKSWYWVFLLVSGIFIGPVFERELESPDGNFSGTIILGAIGLVGLINLLRMLR